jgi:uncharacterized protein
LTSNLLFDYRWTNDDRRTANYLIIAGFRLTVIGHRLTNLFLLVGRKLGYTSHTIRTKSNILGDTVSTVYFTDMRTRPKRNLLDKVDELLSRTKIDKKIKRNDVVAIKLHFGEPGNCAYIRPIFLRTIVDRIKDLGGRPFLTDTNTLYTGSRSNGVTHIETAVRNGFDYAVVGCPIIIADGVRGSNGARIPIGGEIFNEVNIAKEIVDADALVVVSHFKGHELAGFGGALKNMGMGCTTREGKLIQHSSVSPRVNIERCKGCGICLDYCPADAIAVKEKKALIEGHACIGCGECIVVCRQQAIEVQWNEEPDRFQKKMVEHASGAFKDKKGKAIFLNFLMQVSPNCDCYPNNDAPIVRDIGILGASDPVAVDAASCDLVNGEESLPGSAIKHGSAKGEDKFRAIFPRIDWSIQLEHAARLNVGEREYTLVKV